MEEEAEKRKALEAAEEEQKIKDQVSEERFTEVKTSLKDLFTSSSNQSFSLLGSLGTAEEPPAGKPFIGPIRVYFTGCVVRVFSYFQMLLLLY